MTEIIPIVKDTLVAVMFRPPVAAALAGVAYEQLEYENDTPLVTAVSPVDQDAVCGLVFTPGNQESTSKRTMTICDCLSRAGVHVELPSFTTEPLDVDEQIRILANQAP